jgi:nitroreductase
MDILEAIQGRRSIRSYKEDKVAKNTLSALVLESGIWAPSGGNAQTWRFVVITDLEQIRKIRMVSPGLLSKTPALIVICQDMMEMQKRGGDFGREFLTIADSAMAAQNIMLAACDLGLGTCVIASFHRRGVRQILHLPEEIVPMLLISVGIPAKPVKAPNRKKDVIWFNEYNQSNGN